MIIEIGIIAGDIWNLLEKSGDLPLAEINNRLGHKKDHILMSIGWLAREGHIIIKKETTDFKVSLRKAQ